MPRVPSTSPATGLPTSPSFLHTTDCNFVDNAGRTVILRGVNLSGASKAPVGHQSQVLDDFWDSAEDGGESFVGRPLSLDDGSADIHLARLRGWGFNFLRFPFTWEALEHEGPGKYDYEFMDYTIRVLQKCKDYGFRVLMDPHQDTWSRFSGGSGAPFWTLAACGINPQNITATQAAIVHCEYPAAHEPDPATLPAMIWSTNYGRLLSQTIFTLFFAGRTFAPNCLIDGINIQDYLQNHYIEACGQLADRIRAYDDGSLYDDCIVGWDSLNEPFEGMCGWEDLNSNPTKQGSTLKKGTYPTPAQSFRLGMGQAQTVEHWKFGSLGPSKDGSVTIDPKGHKLWADPVKPEEGDEEEQRGGDGEEDDSDGEQRPYGELPDGTNTRWGWKRDVHKWPLGQCIWALHGLWDVETGFILRPDYFKYHPATGVEVEFIDDFWKPHWQAYMRRIRPAHPEAVWFIQPPVFAMPPEIEREELGGRCAYSTHYYDGLTLLTRHWNWFNADALGLLRGKYGSTLPAVKIGEPAIRKSLHEQLGMLKEDANILGKYPTVIGEIGIPFDMDGKKAYGWTDGGKHKGDYSQQQKALDANLNACDGENALNYTIWTFCPDDHSHEWGDGWNMEDLSLWSPADVWEKQRDGRKRKRRIRAAGLPRITEQTEGGGGPTESRVPLVTSGGDEGGSLQPRPSLAMVAAASSFSLATLGTATLTDESWEEEGGPAALGWHSNPFDFLSDGARAVKAFNRPYPVKTVGKPKTFSLDVNKATFKLSITVTHEDQPNEEGLGRRRKPKRRSTNDTAKPGQLEEEEDGEEEEEDEALGTEIYIPLIHFAHPRLLDSPSRRRWVRAQQKDIDSQSVSTVSSTSTDSLVATPANASSAALARPSGSDSGTATPASIDSPVPPSAALRGNESVGSVATAVDPQTSHSGERNVLPAVGAAPLFHSNLVRGKAPLKKDSGLPIVPGTVDDGEDVVDVEVKVSEGKWRVDGQTLVWWYDVPEEGEPEKEVSIEVRRTGGAIKVKDMKARQESWCDQLCPQDGCAVM